MTVARVAIAIDRVARHPAIAIAAVTNTRIGRNTKVGAMAHARTANPESKDMLRPTKQPDPNQRELSRRPALRRRRSRQFRLVRRERRRRLQRREENEASEASEAVAIGAAAVDEDVDAEATTRAPAHRIQANQRPRRATKAGPTRHRPRAKRWITQKLASARPLRPPSA